MSGILDLGDGNQIPVGDDGIATHTYGAAGDYVMTFTPDDGAAATSTTVTATDPPPPPPVESVEWRYDATFETANNAIGVFVQGNGDGSANALLTWDSVFLNDGISVVFFGDPTGQQWVHPDGRIFRVGAYQQQFPLWVGGPPFTNSYEIGLVTYS